MILTLVDNGPLMDGRRIKVDRLAFTLVEMLVAMTVTLLLMAALGRGFNFIGETIRVSRAQVEVTNQLRNVTNRLQTDLAGCTVTLQPCVSGQSPPGYFLYHEGPLTDATSSLFTESEGDIAPHSRYGDFDDYIAFTAVAPADNWFTGIVPRFVLDSNPNSTSTDSTPVVIRSKYAEIVYFASPEYDSDGNPVDSDGIGLPSNVRLHRRVLLIRPDLNFYRIPSLEQQGVHHASGHLFAQAWNAANWLTGMADVHQRCDLSLRRVVDGDGRPTQYVAANSLADLANPGNRFAHVRAPGGVIGGPNEGSMPILALSSAVSLITAAGSIAPPGMTENQTEPVVTPTWCGFLRPEFVLSGQRMGEDVVATSVLGFDAKIFDHRAPIITDNNGLPVRTSDPQFRYSLRSFTGEPLRGDYVDLMYPVLAGGPMRGWQARNFDVLTSDPSGFPPSASAYFDGPFSGMQRFSGTDSRLTYAESLYRSGRILVAANGAIRLFQPAFDTYTTDFERDGFYQGQISGVGTRWWTGGSPPNYDRGADGVNNSGVPARADNFSERETSPPFLHRPESIQISVRLEHRGNRQIHQMSVVHRGRR